MSHCNHQTRANFICTYVNVRENARDKPISDVYVKGLCCNKCQRYINCSLQLNANGNFYLLLKDDISTEECVIKYASVTSKAFSDYRKECEEKGYLKSKNCVCINQFNNWIKMLATVCRYHSEFKLCRNVSDFLFDCVVTDIPCSNCGKGCDIYVISFYSEQEKKRVIKFKKYGFNKKYPYVIDFHSFVLGDSDYMTAAMISGPYFS
jgi:hypothetical protein